MKHVEMNEWGQTPRATQGLSAPSRKTPALPQTAHLAARAARSLFATMIALGLVLLSVLGIEQPATAVILQAATMSGGFVLLALATDSQRGLAWPLALSGLAAVVLALLSHWAAVEFVVIAAPILAVWSAIWVLFGSE